VYLAKAVRALARTDSVEAVDMPVVVGVDQAVHLAEVLPRDNQEILEHVFLQDHTVHHFLGLPKVAQEDIIIIICPLILQAVDGQARTVVICMVQTPAVAEVVDLEAVEVVIVVVMVVVVAVVG
jgi:hypothetical protein